MAIEQALSCHACIERSRGLGFPVSIIRRTAQTLSPLMTSKGYCIVSSHSYGFRIAPSYKPPKLGEDRTFLTWFATMGVLRTYSKSVPHGTSEFIENLPRWQWALKTVHKTANEIMGKHRIFEHTKQNDGFGFLDFSCLYTR